MNECVCPDDVLPYKCTVMGRGVTIWLGTAFNCSSSNHEITLLHNRFSSPEGDYGSCNNGAIVGQSLGIEGNNYTSQLNVTITPDTAGMTIMCVYYNYYNENIQLSIIIPTTGLSL